MKQKNQFLSRRSKGNMKKYFKAGACGLMFVTALCVGEEVINVDGQGVEDTSIEYGQASAIPFSSLWWVKDLNEETVNILPYEDGLCSGKDWLTINRTKVKGNRVHLASCEEEMVPVYKLIWNDAEVIEYVQRTAQKSYEVDIYDKVDVYSNFSGSVGIFSRPDGTRCAGWGVRGCDVEDPVSCHPEDKVKAVLCKCCDCAKDETTIILVDKVERCPYVCPGVFKADTQDNIYPGNLPFMGSWHGHYETTIANKNHDHSLANDVLGAPFCRVAAAAGHPHYDGQRYHRGTFATLCHSINKHCHFVLDHEGKVRSCYERYFDVERHRMAMDNSRVAFCSDKGRLKYKGRSKNFCNGCPRWSQMCNGRCN